MLTISLPGSSGTSSNRRCLGDVVHYSSLSTTARQRQRPFQPVNVYIHVYTTSVSEFNPKPSLAISSSLRNSSGISTKVPLIRDKTSLSSVRPDSPTNSPGTTYKMSAATTVRLRGDQRTCPTCHVGGLASGCGFLSLLGSSGLKYLSKYHNGQLSHSHSPRRPWTSLPIGSTYWS